MRGEDALRRPTPRVLAARWWFFQACAPLTTGFRTVELTRCRKDSRSFCPLSNASHPPAGRHFCQLSQRAFRLLLPFAKFFFLYVLGNHAGYIMAICHFGPLFPRLPRFRRSPGQIIHVTALHPDINISTVSAFPWLYLAIDEHHAPGSAVHRPSMTHLNGRAYLNWVRTRFQTNQPLLNTAHHVALSPQ